MRATTSSKIGIAVSIWTTKGWTFLVLPLLVGGTVSFVTSVSRSTTLGGEEVVEIMGHLYAFPLRVVIPFKSSFGLVMVLLGRVLELDDEASQLVVEESRLDEPKLGNPGLDKLVLDKLKEDYGYLEVGKNYHLDYRLPQHIRSGFSQRWLDNHSFNATISGSEEETIKPRGGMMCQGVRKEIQTKGVISDFIHFGTLGDMQEFIKMFVGIVTRKTMKLARILDLLNHVILKSKAR
nr:hypothetical protein [Tanacetum cinerariifolium]